MYVQTTLLYPGIGKAPELRALLEERTRAWQAAGQRVGLQLVVYGPNTPAFRIGRQFDDLAALETFRQQPQTPDPRIQATFRQPVQNALWELLLAPPAGGQPVRYQQRFVNRPLPGKGPELTALAVENAGRAQSQGYRTGVLVQVAGPAAGAVISQTAYGSLAELETRRASNRTDPQQQEFVRKLGGLLAQPSNSALGEVLVPMQPRQ